MTGGVMVKNTKDTGYDSALSRAKKIIKVLICIFIVLVILLLGKTAYSFGYDVFNQKAMDTEINARDVSITVTDDMSVYEIGKLLKEKKLIEKPLIFVVQEKLSDYKGKIKPGIYELNSAQTIDDILEVLSKADEEEEEASQ